MKSKLRALCSSLVIAFLLVGSAAATPVPKPLADRVTALVGKNNFTAGMKARAIDLMEHPDKLHQGGIGICGLTSSIYALLHDQDATLRERFVALLEAIFNKTAFNRLDPSVGVTLAEDAKQLGYLLAYQLAQFRAKNRFTTADINRLVARNVKKWNEEWFISNAKIEERKQNLIRQLQEQLVPEEALLDFVAARALGRLLKLKDKALYDLQTEVSAHYVVDYNKRDSVEMTARNKGDLAVDFASMKVILKDILSAATFGSVTHPDTEVHTKAQEFWAMAQKVNAALAQSAKQPFAMAAVRGWGSLWQSTSPAVDEGSKATNSIIDGSDILYTHWVIITGPITQDATTFSIPAWTWGQAKTVKVRKSVVRGFFHGFVYGTWKP